MKYDLICIDMFQTLVDIHSRAHIIWKTILNDAYSEENEAYCRTIFTQKAINGFFSNDSKMNEFITLKSIFSKYFSEISQETKFKFDPVVATNIFLKEHDLAAEFEDSQFVFNLCKGKIRICLVSDADQIMVSSLTKNFNFDKVFISEEIGAYKNDPQNRMFNAVIDYYKVSPDRILHIGDSSADIQGANNVGIDSCWINRTGKEWSYSSKPKHEIKSLGMIESLLYY